MAGLGLVLAPHMLRAPVWLTLLTAALIGWRAAALSLRGLLPSRGCCSRIVAVGMLGVWLQYRAIFGRTPGVMLLVMFAGLKALETRNQRDAAALVFLTWFLAITNFLYTQSIPTALGMLAAVAASVAALVDLAAPRRAARANLRSALLLVGAGGAGGAACCSCCFPACRARSGACRRTPTARSTGLSDTMAPGSLSQLTLSDAIAFRVDFQGDAPPRRTLYWRGPVLWDFDGRTWRLGTPMLADLPAPRNGRRVEYSVLLEPNNRNWLFALEAPALLPPRARYFEDGQILMPVPVRARMRYDMVSQVEADPDPRADSRFLGRALRLPPGFNPRARALAEGWRAASAGDVQVLQQAIDYFRRERLQYTTEPPPARARFGGRIPVRIARGLLRAFFLRVRVPDARRGGARARRHRLPGRRAEPGGRPLHGAPVRRARLGRGVPARARLDARRPHGALGAAAAGRGARARGRRRRRAAAHAAPGHGLAAQPALQLGGAHAPVEPARARLQPGSPARADVLVRHARRGLAGARLGAARGPGRLRARPASPGCCGASRARTRCNRPGRGSAASSARAAWRARRTKARATMPSAPRARCPAAGEPIRRIAALYIALRYGPPGGASAPAQSVLELRRMVQDLTFA